MKSFTKRIIEDIKKGGVIFCPRRSGKTTAVLEYMRSQGDSILSCHSEMTARSMRRANRDLEKRIFGPQIQFLVGKREKLIFDEFLLNSLTHLGFPFHAALATCPKRMVAYDRRGKRVSIGNNS